MQVRDVTRNDAVALCFIYNHYIEHTTITFEEQTLQPDAFARRIDSVVASYPWLVVEEGGQVLGYACADEWKSRSAFRYTVESSIYLHPQAPKRRGTGEHLYRALLTRLAAQGFHQVIAAITIPNAGSVALHHKLGFSDAGYFHEVGYKFQQWIDVVYMELRLDAGSDAV